MVPFVIKIFVLSILSGCFIQVLLYAISNAIRCAGLYHNGQPNGTQNIYTISIINNTV